ncbi:putative cytochrome b561, partial [Vibrio cholerae O1 str. NHCC-008D]
SPHLNTTLLTVITRYVKC